MTEICLTGDFPSLCVLGKYTLVYVRDRFKEPKIPTLDGRLFPPPRSDTTSTPSNVEPPETENRANSTSAS